MKDRFYNGKYLPMSKINSFDIEIPEDITDEIDKTLFEIDKYILGTQPEEVLSSRKRKIISKISKWKYPLT